MILPRHWPLLIAEAYEARAYFQRRYQRRKIWMVLVLFVWLYVVSPDLNYI